MILIIYHLPIVLGFAMVMHLSMNVIFVQKVQQVMRKILILMPAGIVLVIVLISTDL